MNVLQKLAVTVWTGENRFKDDEAENNQRPRSARPQCLVDADLIHEHYRNLGIVDGTPGSIGDKDVHREGQVILEAFESGQLTQNQAYHRADALIPWIWNNHSDGVAAHNSIAEVNRLLDKIQGF